MILLELWPILHKSEAVIEDQPHRLWYALVW
jgi:hypothetical protein